MADVLASVSVVLGAEISGFRAAMADARKELRGLIQFSQGLKDIGQSLSTYVSAPLALLGAGAVKVAGDMQALEKGFAATYRGAEPLNVALARVTELAKLPGLGLKEALQGATNLQAAGFSANLAARALGAFGNALATVGKGKADLDGVGLALGQIASKGKISAEEINQLAERVPQIRQAMQGAFGTADTQVLQKLGISATDFVEGVTRELEKLPKVTGGINNAFENLQDSGTTALAKLGTALNKAFDIEGILGKLADAVKAAADSFANLSPATQKVIFVFAGVAAAAGPALLAIGSIGLAIPAITAGFALLAPAAAAAWVAVTGPIGLVVIGIAGVTATVAALVSQYGSVEKAAAHFGGALTGLVAGGLTALRNALATLGFPVLSALVDIASQKVQQLSNKLLGLSAPAKALAGTFNDAFRDIGRGFDGLSGAVGDFSQTIGLLAQLEEQLKAAKDAKPALTSEADIAASNQLIQSLETQIKRLNELGLGSKELAKLRAELVNNANASRALGDLYTYLPSKAKILESGIKSLTDAGFAPGGRTVQAYVAQLRAIPAAVDEAAARVVKGMEKFGQTPEFKLKLADLPALPETLKAPAIDTTATEASLTRFQALVAGFKDSLRTDVNELSGVIANGFTGIASGIGEALANGTSLIAAAGGAILKALGDIAVKKGALLVAEGTANLFTVGLAGLGAAQIAVGGALVAAGAAAGAFGSSISQGGGGASGASTNYSSGANVGNNSPQRVQVEVVGTLRTDANGIAWALRSRDYRNQRTN